MTKPSELLEDLQTGSVIETVPIFAGLTKDPVVFKCVSRKEPAAGRTVLTFEVWYLDVQLETLVVAVENGETKWAAL